MRFWWARRSCARRIPGWNWRRHLLKVCSISQGRAVADWLVWSRRILRGVVMLNLDRLIAEFDKGLRTLFSQAHSVRAYPDASVPEAPMDEALSLIHISEPT